MINKKIKISSIQLIVGLWFLALSLSLSQAEVILTVGDGSGSPGSSDNLVNVSLENIDDKVKAIQLDVCDEDDGDNVDNYLTCAGCETTERTSEFNCSLNEHENGCCRVVLTSVTSGLIEEGTGDVFTLKYDILPSAPAGECRDLNPKEVSVSDENLKPLDVTSIEGEFCFSDSGTTSTTTETTSSTTTTVSPFYRVSISPLSATIKSGESLQFTAKTTYGGEEIGGGTYSWEVVPKSTIESTIGGNGLFTAGDNDTRFDIKEKVKVTDTAHDNKSATATVTIEVKGDPQTECKVAITPLAATVSPGDILTLIANTTGDCDTPQYEWSLDRATDDSSIECEGGTCDYTAGSNDGTEPLIDVIVVTDTMNEVGAEAEITIRAEGMSIKLSQDILWKSRWISLLYLIVVEGNGTHFKAFTSTLDFEPARAVFPFWPLIVSELYIWDIILVMPSWWAGGQDQTVTVTVTTGHEVINDDFVVKLLPCILDQEGSL